MQGAMEECCCLRADVRQQPAGVAPALFRALALRTGLPGFNVLARCSGIIVIAFRIERRLPGLCSLAYPEQS